MTDAGLRLTLQNPSVAAEGLPQVFVTISDGVLLPLDARTTTA